MTRHAPFVAVFLACGLAMGRANAQPKAVPDRSEIEAVVRHYYADIGGQDDLEKSSEAADRLLATDFSFSFGNQTEQTRGLEAHKKWLAWHHDVAKNQKWTVQDLVIENDTAAVRFQVAVTANAPLFGIEAKGRSVALRGMDFFRVSQGHIVELYRVFDARSLVIQLGAACPCQQPAGPK